MTKTDMKRFEQRRARYEVKLGPALAAIAEGDTAVMTTRMSEPKRSLARRYREIVRQLAAC